LVFAFSLACAFALTEPLVRASVLTSAPKEVLAFAVVVTCVPLFRDDCAALLVDACTCAAFEVVADTVFFVAMVAFVAALVAACVFALIPAAAFVLFATPKPTCAKENVAVKSDAVSSIIDLLVFID
jgi:hypothetical protein